jgi:Cd2+/Zn2+-exporting ATPase/Cu+-exporting ATPase
VTIEHQTATTELPVKGMDCAGCTRTVQQALANLPGVKTADVLLASEKAIVVHDPIRITPRQLQSAIEAAGYSVPVTEADVPPSDLDDDSRSFTRAVLGLFGVVFAAVLFLVVLGEWFGLLDSLTERVPFVVGVAIVIAFGFPVFRNVIRASLRRQVISHTLMTVGVLAALAVGEWATAAIVVFFMRVGDFAEHFTTERGRRAVKDLMALAPKTARVERKGIGIETPISEVRPGDIVIVRPGELIPVDGEVISGQATINQAAITGESMPVEVQAGSTVFAATQATLGSLRISTQRVGADSTFGRVIKLVEEAEAHRADVQCLADRFSGWFLPIVASIASLTYIIGRDPIATAAVLVVACSCSLALATPIAMLATIGGAARRGLLIKGGKHVESLARASVLLVDKTGTLTVGRPQIVAVHAFDGVSEKDLVGLTAAAETDSEHPLAGAVQILANSMGISPVRPETFEAIPGYGVRATVSGQSLTVGNTRLLPGAVDHPQVRALLEQGRTLLLVARDSRLIGALEASDVLRPEVPVALADVRALGIGHIELLTGDNDATARALAERIGIAYRANLLPEDKIAIVREYQAAGRTVVMIGDGVNDAPALAQANVGVAMGVTGTDVAMEAAHVALMRDDWMLVPDLFRSAQRTMRVVKLNLGFTAVYNVVGLSLAAFGFLPPVLAAAAQSLPDLGILGNSARLLKQPVTATATTAPPSVLEPGLDTRS